MDQAARPMTETWTTKSLLRWMTRRFEERGIDAPRVVAELLLAHVLECDRTRLYMESDRPASAAELEALRALVQRAQDDEPVQYIVGRAAFFGRDLEVERCTQIPQPCTEDLVEAVLAWQRRRGEEGPQPASVIADVGTGSGCIAIALACQLPGARIVATDLVPAALALAGRNAERHGVAGCITFLDGDGLAPLAEHAPFDAICSNPPYIPDHEWDGGLVQPSVKSHVPASALRGGPDGLDVIRPLIAGAGALLKPGGLLAVEIADSQRDAVLALVEQAPDLGDGEVRKDGDSLWRILLAHRI
jgi:release factor glutamine methyltransferase